MSSECNSMSHSLILACCTDFIYTQTIARQQPAAASGEGAVISHVHDVTLFCSSRARWSGCVMCAVYPAWFCWTPIAVDQSFFLSIGPHQTEQLTLFLCWNAILPLLSYAKWDIRSNHCLILVNLPLNSKVTSLHMSDLRPLIQNPGYGFLKVRLHCSSSLNQGIKSDTNISVQQFFKCQWAGAS